MNQYTVHLNIAITFIILIKTILNFFNNKLTALSSLLNT